MELELANRAGFCLRQTWNHRNAQEQSKRFPLRSTCWNRSRATALNAVSFMVEILQLLKSRVVRFNRPSKAPSGMSEIKFSERKSWDRFGSSESVPLSSFMIPTFLSSRCLTFANVRKIFRVLSSPRLNMLLLRSRVDRREQPWKQFEST